MPEAFRGAAEEFRERARLIGVRLIGEAPAFLRLLADVARITAFGAPPVLLHGETGTGKELIARAIHYLGPRRSFPFVPVNCGALQDSLAENELFGHRAGAFTGAHQESVGLVRIAHHGTLFLDEVDALPAKTQIALLRFLQDGKFRQLGSAKEEAADVRVIAGSNRDLLREIGAGRFREDLYYRLKIIDLELPPLRAREADAEVLARHFVAQCARRYRMHGRTLHDSACDWFRDHHWPGNVRELENLVHREFLLCEDDVLRIAPPAGMRKRSAPEVRIEDVHLGYRAAKMRVLQEFDRSYLLELIQRADGNVTKAARLAGTERRALGKLLKRYQIRTSESAGNHERDRVRGDAILAADPGQS